MSRENREKPLAGWAIVSSNGMYLLGKLQYGGPERMLSPAYAFTCEIEREGKTIALKYKCTPLLMLVSLESLGIPEGAIVIPCGNLSTHDQIRIAKSIPECEHVLRQLRALDAGIVISSKMPERKP